MCFLLCLHIAQINFCGKETETNFQLVTTEEKFYWLFNKVNKKVSAEAELFSLAFSVLIHPFSRQIRRKMCLKVSLLVVLALFGDGISLDLHERLLAKSIVVTLNCFSIHEFIMIKRKAFDSILHYGNYCNIQLAIMEYLLHQQNFIPMTEKFIHWNWKASNLLWCWSRSCFEITLLWLDCASFLLCNTISLQQYWKLDIVQVIMRIFDEF